MSGIIDTVGSRSGIVGSDNSSRAYGTLYSTAHRSGTGYVRLDDWGPTARLNVEHQSNRTDGGGFEVTNAGKYYISHSVMSDWQSGAGYNRIEYHINGATTIESKKLAFYHEWPDDTVVAGVSPYADTSLRKHWRSSGSATLTLAAGDDLDFYNVASTGFVYGTAGSSGIYNTFNIVRIG